MKKIFIIGLIFLAVTIYAQAPISSNRITGSSIVLNNLSAGDVQKIMQGTIFDVFNLELNSTEYNTDLKKLTFLETVKGQEYQQRLEGLRTRLTNQGIKIIPLYRSSTNRDYVTTIGNYDVNRRGFNLTIGYNSWNVDLRGQPIGGGPYTSTINGFRIPNLKNSYFMPVPVNAAQRIEGNTKAVVQLQIDVDTFAIQKIFIINADTLEVYAEVDYETSPPESNSSSTGSDTGTDPANSRPMSPAGRALNEGRFRSY